MKKHYLLTMLLSLFCFAGFASAQEEVTWDLVYSNTLSSTTKSEVVLEDPIHVNGAWRVESSSASQALIDEGESDNNKRFGPYVKTTTEKDYLAVKATGLEAGTYKFSFLHKKGESGDASCALAYSPASEEINTHTQMVSAYGVAIPDKKGAEAGDLIESKTFEITEAGDYYFYYMIWTAGEFKVRIADFKLYKQHVDEPEPVDTDTAIHLIGTTTSDTEAQHNKFYFDDALLGSHTNGSGDGDMRTRSLTYSAWIKVNDARGRVMGYGQKNYWGPAPTFQLLVDGGYYTFNHRGLLADGRFGNDQTEKTSQEVELGEWAFITLVFDDANKTRAFYYNGEEVVSGPYTSEGLGMLNDESAFYICDGTPGSNLNYSDDPDMDLDEVQVWTRALTADEVKASMESVDPSADGLAYLYRFGADRMNSDYTFDNLATSSAVTEDVKAAYYLGSISYDKALWATVFNGTAAQPTFVAGHNAVDTPDPVEEYTVTWEEPVNGTLEVTVGQGITIESGATVEAGASITVTATPAEGYQLETLTVGGEALENGASYAVNSDVEIVATFVEESPWKLVASNLLSAETKDGVDLTNVNAESPKWGVYQASTANGAVLDGKTWGYGLQNAFNKEQVMVKVNIEEAGEYKFSYRMRLDNNDPDLNERYAVLNLFYQQEDGSQTTVSDEDINLYTSTELPATQYESRVINLEPGTYSFGVNHVNNIQGGDGGYSGTSLPGTYLFVGDFKLYKYHQEAQPDCKISWTEPENGTIEVSVYGTDETVENGATVPYGTTVNIVATPAAGYELEGITINGEPYESTAFGYLVTADLNIEATFVEVPVTMYTVSWTADNCDITVKTAEGTTVDNGGEVAEGTELTITATAVDGYELESLTVNGDDFENGTTWTVNGDVSIVATVRGTGIDEAVAEGIYYDAASQTLHVGAAQALSVYDVTGRKVVETAVDGTFDASALRGGIYIAVADGKIVKFRK